MSIVTTFENQCRALTSAPSPDENASRFLVGTQSLNSDNLLYMFEYKDDNNNLAKVSFKFPFGELWHLATFSKHPSLVAGVVGTKPKQLNVSLFKLPQELTINTIEDDYGLSESPVEKLFQLTTSSNNPTNLTRQCHWHPDTGQQLLICNNGRLEFYDVDEQKLASNFSLKKSLENQNLLNSQKDSNQANFPRVNDLRWSSLFNCSVVAAAIGSKIYGIDTRIPDSSSSSICWLIEDERCNLVKSIDFNPNSQYYLAAGGDDCRANFWDLRRTSSPILYLQTHTHWIWSIRYNPFHDQLVLSAGSDARVALMRVQSIASEPFGQMVDLDDDDDEMMENKNDSSNENSKAQAEDISFDGVSADNELDNSVNGEKDNFNSNVKKNLRDEVINVYEEHDDSVYAAEWATDPWIFASLGYESRLVINKVPKKEKFNILF